MASESSAGLATTEPRSKFERRAFAAVSTIEKWGNRLPHPFWIFCFLALSLIFVSALMAAVNVAVTNPGTGEIVEVKSLISREGMQVIVGDVVKNFAAFPPLATILVTMLGIVIAEQSGLINAVLRGTVTRVPTRYVTFALSYAGMIGHVAGDAAYVTLIPLGALIFKAVGRSPVLGAIVAYVSVAAGYDASPTLTTTDVLLSSITTAAAQTIDPDAYITPTSNYFFGFVSSLVISLTITFVVEKFLAKRPDLEEDKDTSVNLEQELQDFQLTSKEVRAARGAGFVAIVFLVSLVALMIPSSSFLRGEDDGLINSPVMTGMAGVIGLFFALTGYTYGKLVGTMEKPSDTIPAMAEGMRKMGPILVLFFAISQFLAYFRWTGIGQVTAISGAQVLQDINAPGWAILLGIAVILSLMNLIITSGSAQWALAAPVFIPMLMLLNIPPETTQAVYRVADSITNCITPMSPYFVMALGFIQQYRKTAGIGTLVSFTLPLAAVLWVVWMTLFMVWYLTGIPFGI